MYADDIKIYKTIEGPVDTVAFQDAITCVEKWSEFWELPLAVEKTVVLQIGKNSVSDIPAYKVSGATLKTAKETKDLGILVSDKLCFRNHCKALVSKANYRIYSLFKVLRTRDSHTLLKAYKTYIRPIVESCTTVFSPYKKKDINLLESIQNNFTRKLLMRCSGLSYQHMPNDKRRRKQLDLPSLRSRRVRNDLVMAFKILTGRAGINSADFFTLVQL